MAATHKLPVKIAAKRHPFDLADFSAILSDLRELPFVSNVWVDDELDLFSDAILMEVDITAVEGEQQTCYRQIRETIGKHASYYVVGD